MAVVSIGIGDKRVHVTAYCPEDEIGLLACEYVLEKVKSALDGTTIDEMRQWMIQKEPSMVTVFNMLDRGWRLPKREPFSVDPSNVRAELQIIRRLIQERNEQSCRSIKEV